MVISKEQHVAKCMNNLEASNFILASSDKQWVDIISEYFYDVSDGNNHSSDMHNSDTLLTENYSSERLAHGRNHQ